MKIDLDKLGEIADSLENMVGAMELPMPPEMHLSILKESLLDKSKELKELYTEASGENPWEEQ